MYDKNTETMVSVKIPLVWKDTVMDYCNRKDKTQSQVYREAIKEYVRYMNYSEAENVQVVFY